MEITTLMITNLIAPIITSFVTWILAKRKYNSEVDSNLILNMKEALDFYKLLSDDNKEKLKEVLDKNDTLEKEISELRRQITNLAINICTDLSCLHRVRETLTSTRFKD